jgi:hypothetical protein
MQRDFIWEVIRMILLIVGLGLVLGLVISLAARWVN